MAAGANVIANDWGQNNNVEPRRDDYDDVASHRVVVKTVDDNHDQTNGANAPTWSPVTWSPRSSTTGTNPTAAQNQTSWVPTYQTSTISPTQSSSNAQTEENNEQSLHHEQHREQRRPMSHPRVACFIQNDNLNTNANLSCPSTTRKLIQTKKLPPTSKYSIPRDAKSFKARKDEIVEEDVNSYVETDTCKYPDPTHTTQANPHPTCNDIHALGFDIGMFEGRPRHDLSVRANVEYVTMGGAKCIWKVTTSANTGGVGNEYNQKETVIFKSNKNSKFLKRQFWDLSRKDALISGGMGNSQLGEVIRSSSSSSSINNNHNNNDITPDVSSSGWNHILPLYHYCALANIVPFAEEGTLEEYILKVKGDNNDNNEGDDNDKRNEEQERTFGPVDTLRVALQAARGLYQAQMYYGGKPTFVHADLNPSQFLVFVPRSSNGDTHNNNTSITKPTTNNSNSSNNNLPILQINDFNQGRFLTRSLKTNETCPFRSCTKNQRGNRYHTPERFMECVDQSDAIDTYSLGSTFFFLLTDGFDPHYDERNYMKAIKSGKEVHVPRRMDYLDHHEAYVALKEVMTKCLAFELRDRPSALEVVRMLEDKLKEIEA
eukprot:CAMPEP_0201672008 /NCGR_PEP_ID=MMETSP0494-20130426/31251_1 /ASSEMBLY_ACC=CAM_ASM_000839 /TAXON_ID=420259 /ORGANISM="Thalassiosira gravida, Strain GMp14c1" /LENGTH=601 /DNA_ID=CAMNT_0048153527 /DNA_START=18 /DNA_END=1823 /DNA_ORIENTATION=+